MLTFSGSKESGTFVFAAVPMFNGTYAVDGKNVTMTVTLVPTIEFKGQFTNKDTMSGTWVYNGGNWTWTATRNTASSTASPALAARSLLLGN